MSKPSRLQAMIPFVLLALTSAQAVEPKSKRPEVGDHVPSYASTKCGGISDGVPVGKTVCYTCRAGKEPIFYVFAHQPSDSLVRLVKQIESLVVARKVEKAAAVINFLGDPKNEQARKKIADFGIKHALQNVTLTITGDGSKFVLNDEDDATVILFEDGIIRFRASVKRGTLGEKTIDSIVRQSEAVLK